MEWFNNEVMLDFLFQIINFLILAAIIIYFVRKYNVIDNVFGGYQRKIQAEIDTASNLQQEAAQIKAEVERSAQDAEARAAEIRATSEQQAAREKAAIIENAQAEAQRVREQLQSLADYENERQIEQLQQGVVDQTLERAQEKVRSSITKTDNDRLVNDFIKNLDKESVRLS